MASGPVQIQIYADAATRTLVLSVPALAGMVGEENYNTLSHARSAIIKNARDTWPKRFNAARFVAASLKRWGTRRGMVATRIVDAEGRLVGLPVKGVDPTRGNLEAMEAGGNVEASDWMAIPVGAIGVSTPQGRAAAERRFRQQLAAGELVVVGRGLLVNRAAMGRNRTRVQIVGALVKHRAQRPLLKFRETFEKIWPKHKARYEALVDKALTAAGRVALQKQQRDLVANRLAWSRAYSASLEAGASFQDARRAAKDAAKFAKDGGNA